MVFLTLMCAFTSAYSQAYNLHVGESKFLGIPFTHWVVTGSANWSCSHQQIVASTDDKESGVIITIKQYFTGSATISVSWTEEYFNTQMGHSVFTAHYHTWTIRCVPVNIILSDSDVEMKPGDTKRLNYSWSDPSWASAAQVEWVSSDPSIATVEGSSSSITKYATITAKKSGNVTITANTNMGPSAVCNVTVTGDDDPLGGDTSGCIINSTNFPDANFRNYLLATSYGKDGVLTDEEIKGVETIFIQDKDISSFAGIEFFSALKKLDCCYNTKLSFLDLSKNVMIESVLCAYSGLTTIDFANNPKLRYLDCSNNQLNSLDLSKNTALQTLYCSGNRLTTLDLSNNIALETVNCSVGQLESLDLSGCTKLKELMCFNNQLTFLDVSGCAALSNIDCDNNQLTSLDVSDCVALYGLYCYRNQLTSLSLPSNRGLNYLYCYCNSLTGSAMDALVNSLPQRSEGDGKFRVFDNTMGEESNVFTKAQAAAVKAKGWTPEYYNGTKWLEYGGSDETRIEGVTNDEQKLSPVYSLSGQRLAAPKKGINIINGRKVIVK